MNLQLLTIILASVQCLCGKVDELQAHEYVRGENKFHIF